MVENKQLGQELGLASLASKRGGELAYSESLCAIHYQWRICPLSKSLNPIALPTHFKLLEANVSI